MYIHLRGTDLFHKTDLLLPVARPFFGVLSVLLALLAVYFFPNYYTSITFGLTAIACALLAWFNPVWRGRFLMMYLVSWLPFLLVNGALTGALTENPVVNYNSNEIINFRVITIPIEDSIYNLLMLMIVTAVYERDKKKNMVTGA